MKFKVTLASVFLLLANNSWAEKLPYYNVEELSVADDGALYGPFPSAISDDGQFIGTYSMKAALSNRIDIALPFTFNRGCQYDDIICDLEFYGSKTVTDLSYKNGYQQWRNAQSNISLSLTTEYSRYFMGNTLLNGSEQAQIPFALDNNSSDVKVTDVTDPLGSERFIVGYASAPYKEGKRDFVRRAFIKSQSGEVTSLSPQVFAKDNGGLSSAYKLQKVTYADKSSKTLVVGASSLSYPRNDNDYFERCFSSDIYDGISSRNELDYCPGFDTQAWAWDVTDIVDNGSVASELIGFPLATHWLENNTSNNNKSLTFSASAFDINHSGVAVGVSTFEYRNSSLGGHQRAVIMTPTESGEYGKPTVIAKATADIGNTYEQERAIFNTWAQAITDNNMVVGNREFATAKGHNKPFEFFIYDIASDTIKFPLLDKKVLTTKQRLEVVSPAKRGANSLAYDLNEKGWVVGEADDYDQTDPVYEASPRSQSAFLYDNNSGESWFINDLLCSDTDGVVTSPYLRIRSARVISDDGTILAEGFRYSSANDYQNKINAQQVAFKLTRNYSVESPNDSPNCWQSVLLDTEKKPYERSGGATFWLWILALPLLFIRRFCK